MPSMSDRKVIVDIQDVNSIDLIASEIERELLIELVRRHPPACRHDLVKRQGASSRRWLTVATRDFLINLKKKGKKIHSG